MSLEASKLFAVSSPLQKRPAPKAGPKAGVGGSSECVGSSSSSSSSSSSNNSEIKYLSHASVDEHGQPLYPETMSSFIEGISGDFKEVLNTFYSFVWKQDAHEKKDAPSNSSSKQQQQQQQKKNINDALKMRCASLWSEKNSCSAASTSTLSSSSSSSSASSSVSASFKPRITVGDIVNLKMLEKTPSLQCVDCCDEQQLIIGAKRMILVEKKKATGEHMALVLWTQNLTEVEGCSLSFENNTSSQQVHLALSIAGSKGYSLKMPNVTVCTRVLQALQEKRAEAGVSTTVSATTPSLSSSSSSSSASSSSSSLSCTSPATAAAVAAVEAAISPLPTKLHRPPSSSSKSSPRATPSCIPLLSPKPERMLGINSLTPQSAARGGGGLDPKKVSSSATKIAPSSSSKKTSSPSKSSLTPDSFLRVDICVRQMKHGVGEVGVRGKMIQDGVSSSKTDIILQHARRVLEENKALMASHVVATAQKRASPNSTSKGKVISPNRTAEKAPNAREAMMAMLANRQKANEGPPPPAIPVEASAPQAPSYTGLKLRDDPLYAKYVKMVKVGLPLSSVASKMVAEQVCPTYEHAAAILTMNPEGPPPEPNNQELASLPLAPKAAAASAENVSTVEATSAAAGAAEKNVEGGGETMPVSEHPNYVKYFKMLKVGLPKDAVKAKMQQEGANLAYLDKDPNELVPLSDKAPSSSTVPVSEHPTYSKYFRMLKMGLPFPAVQHKMVQEGVDPAFLHKDPGEPIPLDSNNQADATVSTVAVSEHPSYAKFFMMKKMGLPVDAVKHKMNAEGVDASFLDKDPTEQVPLTSPSASTDKPGGGGLAGLLVKKSLGTADKAQQQQQKQQQPRKKKLFWKGLDASKLAKESLWLEANESGDGVVTLDETEFNKLFVEAAPSAAEVAAKQAEAAVQDEAAAKKKRINLIDPKRGQNGGIALARLKVPFSLVRAHISNMNDDSFTIEQLRSLEEFLPTHEEAELLKNFKGDVSMLGQAEKYMREMLGFTSAAKHIQCMLYKQQFEARISEATQTLEKIDMACNDVKMSKGLKKVLLTILKVGNQMNDGAGNIGFSLDSLLKLQSAKAFDKKTSILAYVITLVQRSDEASLQFPLDLTHVAEASRLTLDSVVAEKCQLSAGLENCGRILAQAQEANPAFVSFLEAAKRKCEELNSSFDAARERYLTVLNYFGEDTSMSNSDFFATISKFVVDFVQERDVFERQRKAEARRQQLQQQQANDKESKENRRMSTNSAGISGQSIARTLLEQNAADASDRRASMM